MLPFTILTFVSSASAAYLTTRDVPPATATAGVAPVVTSFQSAATPTQPWQTTPQLDPWQCYTQNISTYFDMPTPTGTFLDAFQTYAQGLVTDCTNQGTPIYLCPFPPVTAWCAYTTAAPTSLSSDYSSYASQASSWWSAHSTAVLDTADLCPIRWADAAMLAQFQWLNITIALAGCHDSIGAEANTTTTKKPSPQITTSAIVDPVGMNRTTSSSTNGAPAFANAVDMAAVAGPGFAAFVAAFNAIA